MAHYPPPNNPNVVKVSIIMNRDTRVLVNTFYVQTAGGWTLLSMQGLANVVKTWITTYYAPVVPSTIFFVAIQVRLQNPALPLAYDLALSPAVQGTRTGNAEAASVSATMSERTGLAGKAFRGRMFVPSLSELDVDLTDKLSSAIVVLIGSAISQLITAIFNNGQKMTIFHRPGLTPHPLDNTFNDVISFIVQNLVDSQRRRLPGRGR